MIRVGQTVRVAFSATDDTGTTKVRTVQGRCIFRHPLGRYASICVPAGYCVTLYPRRRRCYSDDVQLVGELKTRK
ncbi:MAG: hypothetical protein II010_07580 [Oscillospiraceae bacterium]|nr:hypothetical protein [Oscillospiraceae bacterium]